MQFLVVCLLLMQIWVSCGDVDSILSLALERVFLHKLGDLTAFDVQQKQLDSISDWTKASALLESDWWDNNGKNVENVEKNQGTKKSDVDMGGYSDESVTLHTSVSSSQYKTYKTEETTDFIPSSLTSSIYSRCDDHVACTYHVPGIIIDNAIFYQVSDISPPLTHQL